MKAKDIIIGITGTGSLVGQAIIKSLKRSYLFEQFKVRIVGFDYVPATVGSYWCEKNVLLPDCFYKKNISEKEWLDETVEQLRKNRIEILFIGIDFELPLFARHRKHIEELTNTHIVISDEKVVSIADDKYLTFTFLKDNNFTYPLTYLPENFMDGMLPYPFILKPRVGARSKDVYIIKTYREYMEKSPSVVNPIVQELIGDNENEYTCGAIFFDGIKPEAIALKRTLKDGNTFKAIYRKDAPEIIYTYLKDVCATLKPHGACNFQLRLDKSGMPKIFEINARHSGTTYMRALLGFNEVTYIIEHFLHKEHQPFELKQGMVIRYFDEFITEA